MSEPAPASAAHSTIVECLPRIGLTHTQVPAILAAETYSRGQLSFARARLATLSLGHPEPDPGQEGPGSGRDRIPKTDPGQEGPGSGRDRIPKTDPWRACATFALGSLGRLEASPESDLDLAFIYDGARVSAAAAERLREQVLASLLDSFDIPQKTFDHAVDLRDLTRNIGGRVDTNETLTYRALLLTEGAWLAGAGRDAKHTVFRAYADGQISRGRFLTSLGNDLHRYYRTLCMDYRHKVEELDKSWAIRVLKLRHSRKLWHLANLALQCWAVDAINDDDTRDVSLAARVGWPSLLRLLTALDHFGAPELAREPFLCFDRFLAALADPQVRDELLLLDYERRDASAIYAQLHDNATRLDAAAEQIVDLLFSRCRPFMVRFCIL